jgi:hypothetical protein
MCRRGFLFLTDMVLLKRKCGNMDGIVILRKGTLSDVFRLNKPPLRLKDKELLPFARFNPDFSLM